MKAIVIISLTIFFVLLALANLIKEPPKKKRYRIRWEGIVGGYEVCGARTVSTADPMGEVSKLHSDLAEDDARGVKTHVILLDLPERR